jgi:hypothetical protein
MADSFRPDSFKADSFTPDAPEKEEQKPREGYKITETEVKDIASKYGVDAGKLKKLAPIYGGSVDTGKGERSGLEKAVRTAAEISENTLLNLPQFAGKKLLLSDKEEQALDEVVERIRDRETLADLGIDLAAGAPGILLGLGAAKGASTAAKIGVAAGMGAAQGVATSKKGEELQGAAIGGTVGAALGGTFEGIGALWSKKMGQKAASEIQPYIERKGQALADKVADARSVTKELDDGVQKAIIDKAPPPRFADKVPDTFRKEISKKTPLSEEQLIELYNKQKLDVEKTDFVRHLFEAEGRKAPSLSAAEAQKEIDRRIATEGKAFVSEQFNNFKDVQTSYRLMREDLDTLNSPKGKFFDRLTLFLSDNRPAANLIDERNGTDLQLVLDNMSTKHKGYTRELTSTLPWKEEVFKEMKDAKIDDAKLINAMRSAKGVGDLGNLSDEERRIVDKFADMFENRRQRAQALGIPIEKWKGAYYVPDQLLDPADTIVAMRNKLREANKAMGMDLTNLSKEEFAQILAQKDEQLPLAFRELKQGMQVVSNLDALDNRTTFTAALRASLSPGKVSEMMDMAASAAMKKEGAMPDFLKEKNLIKLMNNWERDTFRTAYYREGLEKLRTLRQHYLNSNDANAASLVQNAILDITGRQRGTLANYMRNKLTETAANAREKMSQGQSGVLLEMLADAPDFFVNLTNQVYPNRLGWNVKSAATNATQPILMSIPEIGAKYGTKLYMAAYAKAAQDVAKGVTIKLSPEMAQQLGKQAGEEITTKNLALVLRNKGVLGENWNAELSKMAKSNVFVNAANEHAITRITKNAAETANRLNQKGMALFELTESINRYTTDAAARTMAKDFLEGNADAIKYFNKGMGSAYKNAIMKAKEAGDSAKVEELFAQHLTAKTMFNYDRIQMSEFGRYLGPGLSSFTKWPTSIAGDIAMTARTKGAKEASIDIGRRYVAPLALLGLLQNAVLSDDTKKSVEYKTVFGAKGLTGSAPLGSVLDIAEGKVGTPPLVSTAGKGITSAADIVRNPFEAESYGKAWKWLNDTAMTYVPGVSFVDMLASFGNYVQGNEPGGTTVDKVMRASMGESPIGDSFKKDK